MWQLLNPLRWLRYVRPNYCPMSIIVRNMRSPLIYQGFKLCRDTMFAGWKANKGDINENHEECSEAGFNSS